MHDASAKFSSGILTGNVNHYGNFDQCLEIIAPSEVIHGKYCLASLLLNIEETSTYLKFIKNLALSYEPFKGNFTDVRKILEINYHFVILQYNLQSGHIFRKTSIIHWSICVPSSCSYTDVKEILQTNLNSFTNSTPIKFQVQVDQSSCYIKSKVGLDSFSLGAKISMSVPNIFCFSF